MNSTQEDGWKTFLAVARDLSFSQAADGLHVTQSAVTTRIRALEQELGIQLFVRSTRHVALTPAGRAVAERFQRMEELAGEIRDIAGQASGGEDTVSIGCSTSQAILVEDVLRAFHRRSPQVPLRLRTGHSEEVLRWMREGGVDIAVTYLALRHPAFKTTELYRDRLVLVGPEADPVPDPCPRSLWGALPWVYEGWSAAFEAWHRAETGNSMAMVRVDHADAFFRWVVASGLHGFTHARLSHAYAARLPIQVARFTSETEPPDQPVYLAWAGRPDEKSKRLELVEEIWQGFQSEPDTGEGGPHGRADTRWGADSPAR